VDVPRLYLSNDSYPELREVRPRWARTVTWGRALALGVRRARFWGFVAAQVGIAIVFLAAARLLSALDAGGAVPDQPVRWLLGLGWLLVFAYAQLSWGGDMMRSYLRAVSDQARHACPRCGHSLVGHLERDTGPVRCPECGARVAREVFARPYPIPRQFRAFPFWRRRRDR
jgi:DNA-directed RNA polymerase subunit RPC12/RpoP